MLTSKVINDRQIKVIQLIKDGINRQADIARKLGLKDSGHYLINRMKKNGILKETPRQKPLQLADDGATIDPPSIKGKYAQFIVGFLDKNGPSGARAIARASGFSVGPIWNSCERLRKDGVLLKVGPKYQLANKLLNGNGANGSHELPHPQPPSHSTMATNKDIRDIIELLMRAIDRVRQLETKVINDKQKQMLSSFARSFADS